MMRPIIITQPAASPIDLAMVKKHVIADDFTDDDEVLQAYIDAAVQYLDGYTGILGRCIITQQWRQRYAGWAYWLRLPFPDVTAAIVTYLDTDGAEQVVPGADYELAEDEFGSAIRFKETFAMPTLYGDSAAPVWVDLTAGYGNAASVPEPLKQAIKLVAATWYQNRGLTGSGTELPLAFSALTAPYRRVSL